jgi:hypothetical protein
MPREPAPGPDQRTGGDPQNANAFSLVQPDGGSSASRLTLDEILDILGWADGEYTAVCHQPVGGTFCSSVVGSVDASARVRSLPETANVWFSVNPTTGPVRQGEGRGGERQVTRWAALYLDVDVKAGAFPDLDKVAEFISTLSDIVGTRPSVLIYSGHGIQPLWPWEWIARNLVARGYGGGAPVSVGSLTFQAAASNSVTSPQTAKGSAISVRHPVALSRCRRGRKCAEMPLKARRERPNSWSFWRQLAAIVWQSATTATANPPSGRSTTEKTNSKSMMPSKYCRSMGVPFLVWEATDARGDRQCCALVEYTNGQTIATRVLASQGTVNNSVELGRGRSRRGDGRIHVCCAPRRVL